MTATADGARVEPLQWSRVEDSTLDELAGELGALVAHLDAWCQIAADTPPAPGDPVGWWATMGQVAQTSQLLGLARVAAGVRLAQSFMPSVEVLRLTLRVHYGSPVGFFAAVTERDAIFLRQHVACGLPALWPLLDSADNLYAFLEGIPGILDMTRETVLPYGTWFATEAIMGPEGPFTVFPDTASLPPSYEAALRQRLPELEREAATAGRTSLIGRVCRYLRTPSIQDGSTGFGRYDYSKDADAYLLTVFTAYGNGLFAANIRIDRASGRPVMTDDCHLAGVAPHSRRPRLAQASLAPAFTPLPAAALVVHQPGWTALAAEDAARRLAETGTLHRVRIEGDLALPRSTRVNALDLRDCQVTGSVRLPAIRIGGDATLAHVQVGGALDLGGAHGEGDLTILDCRIEGELVLANADVGGSLHLTGVRARGLDAGALQTRGPLVIGPAAPGGFGIIVLRDVMLTGVSTPHLVIVRSHVGGLCELDSARVQVRIVLGGGPRETLFVGGNLDLYQVEVGAWLIVRDCHVGGRVTVLGGRCDGLLRFGLPDDLGGPTIGGDLRLVSAEVRNRVSLIGTRVHGTVRVDACRLGALDLEGRMVATEDADRLGMLVPTRVRNGVEIVATEIGGDLRFAGARIDDRFAGRYALEVVGSRVGQGVWFWDERLAEVLTERLARIVRGPPQRGEEDARVPPRAWRFGPLSAGPDGNGWPITISTMHEVGAGAPGAGDEKGEISTRELLASLSARHVHTEIRGSVRLALCKVGGDVCLTNLRADGREIRLEGMEIEGDLLAESDSRRYGSTGDGWAEAFRGLLRTRVGPVEVQGSRIKGEARLEGLNADRLSIRHSTVQGVVALSEVTASNPADPCTRARLRGDLDLSWSTIDHLVLDGRTLGDPADPDPVAALERSGPGQSTALQHTGRRLWRRPPRPVPLKPPPEPNRLIAAATTIREVELRYPLPDRVDLSDARITVWDFGPLEGQELLDRFRNVLRNQMPFKRNVYQEVEAYLHNAGFEDLAKRVRLDLVSRQHEDARLRLREDAGLRLRDQPLRRTSALLRAGFARWLSRINRFATGNFTSEWRPIFWCWLPVWLASSCYFADPARLDVGAFYRVNVERNPASFCATLADWDFWDGMKFTTRFVLPVVPPVGLDEIDAADERQRHTRCLAAAARISNARPSVASWLRSRVDWFRPSTVAAWVRVLSWLFLSLATGTIFAKLSRTPRGQQ